MKRSTAASHDPASNGNSVTNFSLSRLFQLSATERQGVTTRRSLRLQQAYERLVAGGESPSVTVPINSPEPHASSDGNESLASSATPNISPPPVKVRRMQVGGNPAALNNRSVGDRLKEKQKDLQSHVTTTEGSSSTAAAAPSTSTTTVALNSSVTTRDKPLSDRQRNTVRVISQYLREIGMTNTVETLTDESGCREEDPLATQFREALEKSDWGTIVEIVDQLKDQIKESSYMTLRVTFLEELLKTHFSSGDLIAALAVLQKEYPRHPDFLDRRKHYGSMLAADADYLKSNFADSIVMTQKSDLLDLAEDLFPPTFLLPKGRLGNIIDQAHGSNGILRDHKCNTLHFPNRTSQIISDHEAEVWVLKFSPNGQYLASTGKSGLIYIFKVLNDRKLAYYNRYMLSDELDGINCLSWSGDSNFIACGSAGNSHFGIFLIDIHRIVDVEFPVQDHIIRLGVEKFTVADFFPSPRQHRIVCADQKGNFTVHDVDHDLSDKGNDFEGLRVNGLYCLKDGRTVLASDTLFRIRSYNFENMTDLTLIEEAHPIVSFTLDSPEERCLITTKSGGIRMWCLETRTLIQTFFGSVHADIVVNACFGGANEEYIASGSEGNNRVMIWKRDEKYPVKYLDGHNGSINAIAWNPHFKNMLVSGSDDHTIRVWSSVPPGSTFVEPVPEILSRVDEDPRDSPVDCEPYLRHASVKY
uniref:LisH domain-containing protein n=1 Tax=Panagrellus redivivus TaxID=6233 RepID=A0A7E4UN09_PANRE